MIYARSKITGEHLLVDQVDEHWDNEWECIFPDVNGWIPWCGDEESPLPDRQLCAYKMRGGSGSVDDACDVDWRWVDSSTDIVAYRPILDDTKPEAPLKDKPWWSVYQPEPPEWDGEGLPPVGCECEILGTPTGSWSVGIVDYIDDKHCIWHWAGGSGETVHNKVYNMQFRPVRSEEDKAVDEMMATLGKTSGAAGTARICRELYREGYRKVK